MYAAPTHSVTFTLNGEKRTFGTRADEKLLDLLRREGYRGAKFGCGQGTCGACTVLLDGRAVYACLLYAMQAEGREVRTIESVGTFEKPSEFQQELMDGGAVQCGYCIPGMVIAAYYLLENNPDPTEEEIRLGISGNICRCTGYDLIVESIHLAAERGKALWKK